MSLGEFDLISRYFKQTNELANDNGVEIGIGDDCAILDLPDGYQLAVTTDSLVAGVHFFEDVCPYRLGYKSLAVNLSDLAAMGAEPKWVSLAITLPRVDEPWLSEFSRGFFDLARKHNVTLIGGDTTKGPLSITVSAKGIVPRNKALLRSGAQVGDLICVSGTLGDGALGLASKFDTLALSDSAVFVDALELTEPRNQLGKQLINYASSCIDISDGLIQDLHHIVEASQCSAQIDVENMPLSDAMLGEIKMHHVTEQQALQYALAGGDDYELLFTISAQHYSELCLHNLSDKVTVIGKINANNDIKVNLTKAGEIINLQLAGWDHFKKNK
ncbi:thiamine-monophosphate kinase [Psychromonas marina]|uniref:Thiamine-monophosphate kinase n=1 Tax=Psychromonas marina TaxID=88364 RepID=A0ABQ6E2M8_9GAMM|nr:thiamine-phosphate kinase [Psychromonas marina]GLS91602.1 thiamine-monophosphate kinase [Psychromonas marina]